MGGVEKFRIPPIVGILSRNLFFEYGNFRFFFLHSVVTWAHFLKKKEKRNPLHLSHLPLFSWQLQKFTQKQNCSALIRSIQFSVNMAN